LSHIKLRKGIKQLSLVLLIGYQEKFINAHGQGELHDIRTTI
jgi:hypothetical protein